MIEQPVDVFQLAHRLMIVKRLRVTDRRIGIAPEPLFEHFCFLPVFATEEDTIYPVGVAVITIRLPFQTQRL
ncbi:hypothetical protein [Paraburkholderia phytofirmans]|uniref:hypothetical protein n=1 Tax=Paraburkholderia phytofirmans TaxID=261302 RepID=UPI0005A140FB